MEVVVQRPSSPTMDNFDFGSNVALSSYQSVPSSPKRFGEYYLSAPASPSRLSQLYNEFEYFSSTSSTSFEVANKVDDDDDENEDKSFAFFVNGESDKSSRSAEELFDGGKIKPLNESRNSKTPFGGEQKRGRERERNLTMTESKSGRRSTRSHSPYRKSLWEAEQQPQQQPRINKEELPSSSGLSSSSSSKGSKRWSLKDFLLFRSASEGRASSKYPLKKKNGNEEVKGSSSFRSSDSMRKKGPLSAHELHYNIKKAESADMKKRTFLPYRQGILGRLGGFGL